MYISDKEERLRLSALNMAADCRAVGAAFDTHEILKRAQKFYEFLTSENEPTEGDHNGTK